MKYRPGEKPCELCEHMESVFCRTTCSRANSLEFLMASDGIELQNPAMISDIDNKIKSAECRRRLKTENES